MNPLTWTQFLSNGTAGTRISVVLLLTAAASALIALFLTAVGFGGTFWVNLWFSQSIGLSTCLAVLAALNLPLAPRWRIALVPVALVAGPVLGTAVAALVAGNIGVPWPPGVGPSRVFLQSVLIGLVFGVIGSYFFISRAQMASMQARLREEQLRNLEAEKSRVEMQLRLLQAQTEPHFLFNTLAHVLALIDTQPERGKAMLATLIDYLRRSLQHARTIQATLGDELAIIGAYLDILRIRMGERLQVHIEVPEELARLPLPPMLLQPLVENAIKHGLEPKIEGGELWISARGEGGVLVLEVADSGLGFSGAYSGTGVGLANLRERLAALFGKAASLELEERTGGGVLARLRLPRKSG